MFDEIITKTPFSDDIADTVFPNIVGGYYGGDETFKSTMRALVAPRMGKEDFVGVKIIDSRQDPAFLENTITIWRCTDLDWAKQKMEEREGWNSLDKISVFFQKQFSTLCYIKPAAKSVVIIMKNITYQYLHYLQCAIPAYLPWYFPPEKGITSAEMDLINSLREKTSDKYLKCLFEIAKQYDFKAMKVRKYLEGFETKFESSKLESLRQEIENDIVKINQYSDLISNYLQQKRECEIRLLGLETKIAQSSGSNEMMDYFLSHKGLTLESTTDDTMVFIVDDCLEFFDEDMAMAAINNDKSFVYETNGRRYSEHAKDKMRLFMTALVNGKIKIRSCAAFSIAFGGGVRAISHYDYGTDFKNSLPNPHLDAYSCLGDYQRTINESIKANDYVMAVEQCIASTKSLNFGDSPVMNEFMRRIYGGNRKFVEIAETGQTVSVADAIKYLEEESKDEQNDKSDG